MGSKVVLALCALAVALASASGAEARKPKSTLISHPDAHILKPHHQAGHRGASSFGHHAKHGH